jgi:putative hydrolase of the HAD superfamily
MLPKITTIIFDYGGVIEVMPPGKNVGILDLLSKTLGLPIDDVCTLYFQNNHRNNVGSWSQKQTLLHVVSLLDASKLQKAETMLDEYYALKQTDHEVLHIITSLKEEGYIVALLSNYNSLLRTKIKENGADKIFEDNVFISCELGLQKPDPKIFEFTFDKLVCTPEECLFVDDSPKSLSTAKEVGYHPILYTGINDLQKQLKSFGIVL